jgi:hypothetical protein
VQFHLLGSISKTGSLMVKQFPSNHSRESIGLRDSSCHLSINKRITIVTKDDLVILKKLRAALLMRGDKDLSGVTVVDVSSSIWIAFNTLIDEADTPIPIHIPKPYSKALGKILEEQGVLQIDTSSSISLGAKALLDEADALVVSGFLTSITGIHGILTFQPKQEENK